MAILAAIFLAIAFLGSSSVQAGEPGALCSDGITPVLIPCEQDCASQHNSTTGTCTTDGTYNCVCSGPGSPVTSCTYPFNILGVIVYVPELCQCGKNDTAFLTTSYNQLCETDCKCNHGAASGTCDWNYKQCICNWPEGFVWDQERVHCGIEGQYDVGVCLVSLVVNGTLPPGC